MKLLAWGIAGLIVLAGAWFGRAAWHAHRNLVTLHVRNVPLAAVVRSLERQTWEHVEFDHKIDALVTLNVKNKPLSAVLDQITRQVGARWSTVYAVYNSKSALHGLEASLRGERKLEDSGWKVLAPAGLIAGSESDSPASLQGISRILGTNSANPGEGSFGGSGPRRIVFKGSGGIRPEDIPELAGKIPPGAVIATADATSEVSTNSKGSTRIRTFGPSSGSVMRVFRKSGAGGAEGVQEETWSPVQLLAESKLGPQLKGEFGASPEAAAEAAHQVKGRWKTYYALKKSAFGLDLAGLPGLNFNQQRLVTGSAPGSGDTNAAGPLGQRARISDNIEEMVRRQKLEDFGKLTAEQRVLRARGRRGITAKPSATP